MVSVDGEWNQWTDWDTCNVTCGGGRQGRVRTCNQAQHGGQDCEGAAEEERDCNTHACPGRLRTETLFSMTNRLLSQYYCL